MRVDYLIRSGLALGLVLWPFLAAAQPPVEGASDARLHLGPLALSPRLSIENVGVDTNVFNDTDEPVRDFTATVGPEVDSWIRVGRLAWAGTSLVAWNYFREATSQRSFDLSQEGRLQVSLGRVIPYAVGSAARTRQRPNVEIDARVRRDRVEIGGGVEVLIGGNTSLAIERRELELEHGDAVLQGVSLADALDRHETATAAIGRYVMTPLTTLVVEAEFREDRFGQSPDRDSDSFSVVPALEFKPLALIAGRAAVGVRRFEPKAADLAGFTGVVSDVELRYQVADLTRFSAQILRDVDYSFELLQPYYVATGARLSVIQALGGGWDAGAHAGQTTLDYRSRQGSMVTSAERDDRVTVYGVTVGRRFGTDIRVGLDVEHIERTSDVEGRAYRGLRGGGAFTYGF